MAKMQQRIILFLALLCIGHGAGAAEPARGLDEQVQEVKSEVLSIAAELNLLEEQLLYPAQTQIAVFVSLAPGENFRLDSLDLSLDGQPVARHLYTYKELEALRQGGVQRLHAGNLATGEHPLAVTFRGQTAGGGALERSGTFTLRKALGPGLVEIVLAEGAIDFRSQTAGTTQPPAGN